MAVPQDSVHNGTKPFNPPAWIVKKAKENAAKLGYAPNAFAKKLQEVRDNPEEARRKADEHAMRMGVDPATIVKRLAWASANTNPSIIATRPRMQMGNIGTGMGEQEAIPSPLEPIVQLNETRHTKIADQPKASTKVTPVNQPQVAQHAQIEKRDARRAKKEKARSKQAVLQHKSSSKSTLPTIDGIGSATLSEPSKSGAARGQPEKASFTQMDVDPSPSHFVSQAERYPVISVLPKWYSSIKDTSFAMVRLAKKPPQDLTSLQSLKNCIGRCEVETKRDKLNSLYEELRDHVHKAEIKLSVNRNILKKARILNVKNGLPRIFKVDARFPSDLKADSYQLYIRWLREDFSQDILRGILKGKATERNADRLDTTYKAKFPASANHYGERDLVLGQWWPTQLCIVRDGVHGASQGGIWGDKERGAYSIVLSGGGYHDTDDGDLIEYSGTEGKDFTPTDATLSMIKSAELGNDIRVIRSSMLPKTNKYRPEVGLRYDGLYRIKGFELVDKEKQMHRFKLERCPGQEQIRCEDNAARRPTIFEIEEFRRSKI